jgi:hypothetical protein
VFALLTQTLAAAGLSAMAAATVAMAEAELQLLTAAVAAGLVDIQETGATEEMETTLPEPLPDLEQEAAAEAVAVAEARIVAVLAVACQYTGKEQAVPVAQTLAMMAQEVLAGREVATLLKQV